MTEYGYIRDGECHEGHPPVEEKRYVEISAAIDTVQKKQVIVVEVYGDPLDLDTFIEALDATKKMTPKERMENSDG